MTAARGQWVVNNERCLQSPTFCPIDSPAPQFRKMVLGSLSNLNTPDVGSQLSEFFLKPFIAAVQMVDAIYVSDALGNQSG